MEIYVNINNTQHYVNIINKGVIKNHKTVKSLSFPKTNYY